MQRPLLPAQVAQGVGGQVQQLTDAHAGVSEQKQGLGQQIVLGTQLLPQKPVVLGESGLGRY